MIRKFLSSALFLLASLLLIAGQAVAAIAINAVTLNGATSVTVAPGATISANVNVTTSGSGTDNDWESVGWRISTSPPGAVTCNNSPGFTGSGTNSQTFSITAPSSAGTYNAYFIAYNSTGCGSGASSTLTLANAVTVAVAPATTGISPASKNAGDDAFTMTVNGSNFVAASQVQLGGASRATTFISATQLTAAILASDMATEGSYAVTVVNPGPSGGTSNAQTFTVLRPFCSPPADAPAGVNCVCDNFNRTSLNPSTIFGSNWIPSTSDSTGIVPLIVNPGYLRLTNNTPNNAKAVTVPGIFPAAGNYISVEFKHYAYNGSGADGIAVILSDYRVTPNPGAFGGSLGYAQKSNPGSDCTTTGGCPGFAGGWLGVGLDEYGNYQNPTEGRIGGTAFIPQSVGMRGSGSVQTGYNYLAGTSGLSPGIDDRTSTTASRGNYYQVIVDARNEPVSTSISVNRDTTGTGNSYSSLFSLPNVYSAATARGFTQAPVPPNWYISFTGSTGASNNIHEIGGLRICALNIWPLSGGKAVNFNAIDEAYGPNPTVLDYNTGHIYTKLVGVPFKLYVAFIIQDQIFDVNKNVTVKLVDNSDNACIIDSTKANYCSSSCTSKSSVVPSQTLLLSHGKQISTNFNVNKPYSNLVAIINDGVLPPACSTDAFAVRPLGITSVVSSTATNGGTSGTPKFKAGSDQFPLTATIEGPVGYMGVLKINNSAVTKVGSAVVAGTLAPNLFPATESTSSTVTGTTFTYSEVGAFTLPGYNPASDATSLRGVFDGVDTANECDAAGKTLPECDALRASTWTGVDSISTKGDCVFDSYSNTMATSGFDKGKYGCNFGLMNTTASIGRFIPDHFSLSAPTLSNRSDVTGGSASTFSYMDEPMAVSFTLTAQNASNGTTKNYINNGGDPCSATQSVRDASPAKLCLTSAASFNFAAVNDVSPRVFLPGRLTASGLTGAWPNQSSPFTNNGVATVTGTLTLSRPAAVGGVVTPDGPYNNLTIGAAPREPLDIDGGDGVTLQSTALNQDMINDVAAPGSNDRQQIGTTSARFGRLRLGNAYGPDSMPLRLPVELQYWNGTAFQTNYDDSLTPLAANQAALSNCSKNLASNTACAGIHTQAELRNSSNVSVPSIIFNHGQARLILTAPGAGNNGSVDVCLRLGASTAACGTGAQLPANLTNDLSYLKGNWSDMTYTSDPKSRASFGLFNSNKMIYLRENY